jgi:WD40 repeat protein
VTPDGQRVITGGWDGTAKVWEVTTNDTKHTKSGHELFTLKGHAGAVLSVAVTPDGQRIITAGKDGTARVWDAASGRELFVLRRTDVPVLATSTLGLLSSPHAQGPLLAASALYPGRMGHTGDIQCIAVTPDGQQLVVGRWGVAQVWDLRSGREILILTQPAGVVKAMAVAVTPDGQRVVMGSWNGWTRLCDITDGRELLTLPEPTVGVTAVAVTPDNLRLITGRSDGTVTVWDAASGQKLFSLRGPTDMVTSIAVTADGQRIITASVDGAVRLWDAVNGRELLALKGDGGPVRSVAVTPDGRRIVTGCEDGTVKIWEAASPEEVAVWTRQDQNVERAWAVWQGPVRGAPGFIQDWLVLAPLALEDDQRAAKGVEREQLPGEANLRPREGDSVRVRDEQHTWRAHHAEEPVLDFNRFAGRMCPNSVAYAVCYVFSDMERHDLLLQVGSDDEAKVYLNGQEIYKYTRVRGGGLDPSRPITLRKGINVLVLKVVNENDQWLGYARFVDREGNLVPGLQVRLTPE